jgi:sulfite exporter TauE/SafE
VAAFLAGKLVSHTLLGMLLGVFGAGLQPSPRARAVLLLAAGALMVLFALDLFGVKAVGRLVPRPPAAFGRLLRRTSRAGSTSTAPLLGFATVLVPCGVTLSVELIAVTSGSPVAGAAVMAGFVLGTAPLFTGLGYLFRRSSRALSGRLGVATGLVVLAVAVWTVTSGLRAGGWVPADSGGEAAVATAPAAAAGRQVVTITVTDSYTPKKINARAGVPTTLVLQGRDASGCVRAFTIPARGIQEIVDPGRDTAIDLGTPGPGTLRFSCAMGMYGGTITFQGGAQ